MVEHSQVSGFSILCGLWEMREPDLCLAQGPVAGVADAWRAGAGGAGDWVLDAGCHIFRLTFNLVPYSEHVEGFSSYFRF